MASLATHIGKNLKIFIGHGTADGVVKYAWGEQTRDYIRKDLGMNTLEFNSYKGVAHSASMEELNDLKRWLEQTVPAEAPASGSSS
jgi:predicted esterase